MRVLLVLLLVGALNTSYAFWLWDRAMELVTGVKRVYCPKEIEFNGRDFVECSEVCNAIKEKHGYKYTEVIHEPIRDSREMPIPRVCTCRFTDKEPGGSDPPYVDVICSYLYTLDAPDTGRSANFNLLAESDIPTKLVRLFTFRANQPVPISDAGAIVLSGFYSAYVEIIRGWTSFFALALVIIVAGWNMLLPGVGALLQKIRYKETDVPAISAEALVRIAMAVIPAAGFFALPVPVGREGVIFMENVVPDQARFTVVSVSSGGFNTEEISGLFDERTACSFYDREIRRLLDAANYAEMLASQYGAQGPMSPQDADREYENFRNDIKRAEERFKNRMENIRERIKQRIADRINNHILDNVLKLPTAQQRYVSGNVDELVNRLADVCLNNALASVRQYIQGVITSYTYQVAEKLMENLIRQKTGIDPTGFINAVQVINNIAEEVGRYCGIDNMREVVWQVQAQVLQEVLGEMEGEIRIAVEEYLRDINQIAGRYKDIPQRVDNWVTASSYREMAEKFRQKAQKLEEEKRKCMEAAGAVLAEGGSGDIGGGWTSDEQGGRRFAFVLYRSGDTAYLPLAVGVVGSFVEFGIGGAKAVASAVNGIINAYMSQKISQTINAIEQAKQENRQYWKRLYEQEAQLLKTMSGAVNQCGFSSCADVMTRTLEQVNDPKCVNVYHYVRSYCEMIRQRVEQSEREATQQESAQVISQRLSSATAGLSSAFTWISPAVITQAPLYSMFVSLSTENEKVTKLSLVYKSESRPDVNVIVKDSGDFVVEIEQAKRTLTLNDLDVNVGLSKESFYFYGMAIAITSIPPGSSIKSAIGQPLKDTIQGVGKVIKDIGKKLVNIPIIGKLAGPTIVTGEIIKLTGAPLAFLISTMVAYVVTVLIFKMLPFLVVSGVVIFRFIAYLFDLAKFMITLPFFAVGAATRNPASALQFFAHTLKLSTTPILIAFMPLVAFVAIELVTFFFFDVPMYFILKGAGVYDSHLGYFFAGMFNGFLFIASTIIAVVVAWDIASGFIDGVYAYVNNMVGAYYSSGDRVAGAGKGMFVGRLT